MGPTRAKQQWAQLSVDGMGIANEAPSPDFPLNANPRLTVRMVARIQGFPDSWEFVGGKTVAYRQVGNAFPPPVARALGDSLLRAFSRRLRPQFIEGKSRQLVLLEPKARVRRSSAACKTA